MLSEQYFVTPPSKWTRLLVCTIFALLVALVISLIAHGSARATTVSVTDTNVQWSPYGWIANGSVYKQSPTTGAFFDVAFNGNTLGLNVDTSFIAPSIPTNFIVSAYIDGNTVPITRTFADVVAGQIIFSSALPAGNHYAHVVISQNTNYPQRWNAVAGTPPSSLRITSIQLQAAASVLPVSSTPLLKSGPRMIYYGDSITDGNNIGGTPAESSQASIAGEELGALYGNHGYASLVWYFSIFSSTPDFHYLTGDVNYANAVWRNYYQGTSILNNVNVPASGYVEGGPDVVFNNLGVNDVNVYNVGPPFGGAFALSQFQQRITSWLGETRQAVGVNAPIFMVVPFNYYCTNAINPATSPATEATYAIYLPAYINTINQYKTNSGDQRVYIIDLGVGGCQTVVANSVDGLHPNPAGAQILGQQIAALARPNIYTTLAASVSASSIQNGTNIASTTPTITGTGIPGSNITVSIGTQNCTTSIAVNGNWSCTFASAFAAGSYTFRVTETAPWNQVFTYGPFTITIGTAVDPSAPTLAGTGTNIILPWLGVVAVFAAGLSTIVLARHKWTQ